MIYIFAKKQRIFKEPEKRSFKNYDALLNFFIKEQKKSKNEVEKSYKIVSVFQIQEKINIIVRQDASLIFTRENAKKFHSLIVQFSFVTISIDTPENKK